MENIEVMFSSKKHDWSTPQDFFNLLDEEFHFNIDVCANEGNAKCINYYDEEDDGLIQDWGGKTCFCNPPYSDCGEWIEKCYNESKKPNTTVVALIPSRTDTKYFHNYIYPFWNGNKINHNYTYAAGLFDGEGCIRIQEHLPSEKNRAKNPSYSLNLFIKMTDKRAINRMYNIFNKGHITIEKRPEPYKDCYKWEVSGIDAFDVITKIYPFSIVKQEQLMYGIEYWVNKTELSINDKKNYKKVLTELKQKQDTNVGVNTEIRFIKGRLKFGDSKNAAPFPSMVVIFRGPEEI